MPRPPDDADPVSDCRHCLPRLTIGAADCRCHQPLKNVADDCRRIRPLYLTLVRTIFGFGESGESGAKRRVVP